MEQINKIELRGNVGNVRLQTVGEKQVIRFSLATNYSYKAKNGDGVIETTWHNISAWEGKGMPDFSKIEKGSTIHVVGRLKSSKYEGADGSERQSLEVIANRVMIEDESATPQFGNS
jgi:single-strand DNA-binding protein